MKSSVKNVSFSNYEKESIFTIIKIILADAKYKNSF